MNESIDVARLEQSPMWDTIVHQLEKDSVTQVAQRHGLPPSAIRAAQRRTGVGARKTRVVRPDMIRMTVPEKPAAALAPPPAARTRQTPSLQGEAANGHAPVAVPSEPRAAPVTEPRAPAPRVRAAPKPKAVAAPAPQVSAREGGPVWAWRVFLRDSSEAWFVVAPTLADAAITAERAAMGKVERVVRFGPVFG